MSNFEKDTNPNPTHFLKKKKQHEYLAQTLSLEA